MKNALYQAIQNALNSDNSQKVLEGTVAYVILQAGISVVGFNKAIGLSGSIGEIDIETSKTIIEITTQTSRKLKQIQKLLTDPDINPLSKPVILYAPNYKATPAKDILNLGAYWVQNNRELIQLLRELGE